MENLLGRSCRVPKSTKGTVEGVVPKKLVSDSEVLCGDVRRGEDASRMEGLAGRADTARRSQRESLLNIHTLPLLGMRGQHWRLST